MKINFKKTSLCKYFIFTKMTTFDEKVLKIISNMSTDSTTPLENPFKDKWVSILGDSLSTYEGWTNNGYSIKNYYGPNGKGTENNNDVDSVEYTWWHKLLTRCGAKLCVNNSIRTSRIAICAPLESENTTAIKRVQNKELTRKVGKTYINLDGTTEEATEKIEPDIIIVFMGTNDYVNDLSSGLPPEGIKASNYSQLTEDTFGFQYEDLMLALQNGYPRTDIYLMMPFCAGEHYLKNSSGTYAREYYEIVEGMADMYLFRVIPNHKIVKSYNYNDYIYTDDSNYHYTKDGMEKLADGIYSYIISC